MEDKSGEVGRAPNRRGNGDEGSGELGMDRSAEWETVTDKGGDDKLGTIRGPTGGCDEDKFGERWRGDKLVAPDDDRTRARRALVRVERRRGRESAADPGTGLARSEATDPRGHALATRGAEPNGDVGATIADVAAQTTGGNARLASAMAASDLAT